MILQVWLKEILTVTGLSDNLSGCTAALLYVPLQLSLCFVLGLLELLSKALDAGTF